MFNFGSQRIYVVDHRVDFRLRHNGLLAQAYALKLNPFDGDIIVFVSRRKREVRILAADTTGIWLNCKIFTEETIRTQFSFLTDPNCHQISPGELAMLMEGTAYEVKKRLSPIPKAA